MTGQTNDAKKQQIIEEELSSSDFVLVHFNPQDQGVSLPEHLTKTKSLTLKLSYYFAGSVSVGDGRINARLSFSGQPFDCQIPLTSVWGLTTATGEKKLWPGSGSGEKNLYSKIAERVLAINPKKTVELKPSKVNKQNKSSKSSVETDNPEETPPTRPGLKLVK